jgi:hypothetical protein
MGGNSVGARVRAPPGSAGCNGARARPARISWLCACPSASGCTMPGALAQPADPRGAHAVRPYNLGAAGVMGSWKFSSPFCRTFRLKTLSPMVT